MIITREDIIKELNERIESLKKLIYEVEKNKNAYFYKNIAVDLRVLLGDGQGENLLKKAMEVSNFSLVFSYTKPWGDIIKMDLDGWKNETIFAINGDVFSRIRLIKSVADQRGAHFDKNGDKIHDISKAIELPFGNPIKDGLGNQNVVYIVRTAKDLINVVEKQFIKI